MRPHIQLPTRSFILYPAAVPIYCKLEACAPGIGDSLCRFRHARYMIVNTGNDAFAREHFSRVC